jgi:pescadillo protein
VHKNAVEARAFTHLFDHLHFFVSREVPLEMMDFVIGSFAGRVGWDGVGSPFAADSPVITHVVVDRPLEVRRT